MPSCLHQQETPNLWFYLYKSPAHSAQGDSRLVVTRYVLGSVSVAQEKLQIHKGLILVSFSWVRTAPLQQSHWGKCPVPPYPDRCLQESAFRETSVSVIMKQTYGGGGRRAAEQRIEESNCLLPLPSVIRPEVAQWTAGHY